MVKKPSPVPNAREVYRHAVRFQIADDLLRRTATTEKSDVVQAILFPAIVLSAFSSELFLKCLILLEHKIPINTHNLLMLFRQLSSPTQSAIRANWAVAVNQNEMEFQHNEKALKVVIPRDLDSALTDCGDAFKLMRYIYEDANTKFYIADLPQVLHQTVRQLDPGW